MPTLKAESSAQQLAVPKTSVVPRVGTAVGCSQPVKAGLAALRTTITSPTPTFSFENTSWTTVVPFNWSEAQCFVHDR